MPSRTVPTAGRERPELWTEIQRVVGRAPCIDDARAQRVHLIAAARLRALGRPVPDPLLEEERMARLRCTLASLVLDRVRAASSGPVVIMKGIEVASRYPRPSTRPFRDLDLLVEDAPRVQQELLDAGFVRAGFDDAYYADRHHLTPLVWPEIPIAVEVHRRPEWPGWGRAPSPEELIAAAVPAACGVDGIAAPPPGWHAVLLAAHAWSEAPLRRLLDLVDAAVLAAPCERDEIAAVAERWGVGGMWATTIAAADALFAGAPVPWSLRLWARNLRAARDRTVLEGHVARLAAPACLGTPGLVLRGAALALATEVRPAPGESWQVKRQRARRALRHRSLALAKYDGG